MHRNGHDGVAYSAVTSPDANHFEPGFLEGSDHLHAGGSRKSHTLALVVFRGTEISTGIGLPSFLATSTYPAIASSICISASSRVDPSMIHPGRDGTVTVYPPSSFCSKNGITETSFRQASPSGGEVVLKTIKGLEELCSRCELLRDQPESLFAPGQRGFPTRACMPVVRTCFAVSKW